MHTINPIKRYKIFSHEDLREVSTDEYASIEIYAKNMTFSFTEIEGNLLVRGEGCSFPDLQNINGNLSVDAGNCSFPNLKNVGGNVAIHASAVLDRLEKVKGDLKCIVNFRFKNSIKIEGSIELKNAEVYAADKKLKDLKRIIEVLHQYQVDFLPKDGIFNVDVKGDDITFLHQQIRGKMTIYGKNVSFPNLEYIHGQLKIKSQKKNEVEFDHDFPTLKKMMGVLTVDKPNVCFPALQELVGNIEIKNSSYAAFPLLEKAGNVRIKYNSRGKFPILREVKVDLASDSYEECEMTELKMVKRTFYTSKIIAKNIEEVGNLVMNKYCEFDHLKKIGGVVVFDESFNFKSLEYIGCLTNEKQKGSKLPSLQKIGHYLYDENDAFEDFAEQIYFKVKDNLYITPDKCYIAQTLPNNISEHFLQPLQKLVSILKLRHKSFQNFITREYEREWINYSSPNFSKVLHNIEKIWTSVEPITYEEFFTHYDRGFRLFCFSYFGVGALMEKLNAKKINQKEILVNYCTYDKNGNKKSLRRTNHYEIFEVENENFRLSLWGREKYSYAVKCWCPSTLEEHWLWIEPQYKDDALAAIASTFRIHENIIPHIQCLKRQGDLLICELKTEVIPKGNVRPLTAEEYFSFLEAES
ncbi:hypothetical protein [Chryseobacterium sp. Mn2064]|uniref:hypothetical protein n=1 Tax=Chryseobacterium sp. Mn2064 TaxID=3395263 RepID=UPI003BD13F25